MPRYCLEDFEPGLALPYGPLTVSLEEMLGFSRRYDPQPMHIDAEAARGTFAGKLIARVGLATNKPAEFIILRISQDTRALEAELAAAEG